MGSMNNYTLRALPPILRDTYDEKMRLGMTRLGASRPSAYRSKFGEVAV
jgi:hypothetical protein